MVDNVLKFISLNAAIGLLVVIGCAAVLALGAQAWLFSGNPLWAVLISGIALVILVGLGVLLSREVAATLAEFGTVVESLGRGDLTRRMDKRLTGEIGMLAHRLNAAIDELDRTVQGIASAAWAVAQKGHEIERDCQDLSAGAGAHASELSRAGSSMAQLARTINGNAEHAGCATRIAGEAESRASDGAEVLTTAIVAMDEIAGSGRQIGEIVAIIDSIAFQTNLLALNAAVEAARAGESGRGFAVVATEVRNLAQRAGAAAREIRELIRASVEAVEQGERLVTRTGEAFSEIRGAVLKVNEIVADIVTASAGQRSDIGEINRALEEMGRASSGATALADQAASTAALLIEEAQGLSASIGRFRRSPEEPQLERAWAPRRVRVLASPKPLGGESG